MSEDVRLQIGQLVPAARSQLAALDSAIRARAAAAGVDPLLLELVRIRASQLNGCAYCIDLHSRDARERGATDRQLSLLPAWRDVATYSESQRAALELTEALTRMPPEGVPQDTYDRAVKVLGPDQFGAIGWAVIAINAYNRLGVLGKMAPPPEP